jgi:hypothetical protein
MTSLTHVEAPTPPIQFDFAFVRKCALWFAGFGLAAAPFVRDPLAMAGGCFMPWLLVTIIDTPRMPSIAVYFLLWQWLEVASRVAVGMVDNESIGDGLYGPNVIRAYWYCFASLIALAFALRVALSNLPNLPLWKRVEHLSWRPSSLFWCYLAIAVVASPLQSAALLSPGLAQPVATIGTLKTVALLMLFITTLSSGRGRGWAIAAIVIEAGSGFVGFFSNFKEVFFLFGLAALSARITFRPGSLFVAIGGVAALVMLMLFWTAIKTDYRDMASGGSGVQAVTAPLTERLEFLGRKILSPGEISWSEAGENLLRRMPAIDFFGATITTIETAPETGSFNQWYGVFNHVFRPRILFPDKEALNDIELYDRLVRADITEEQRAGTSIGVGYLAENFVDCGFPAMLLPVFALGLLFGYAVRYFLTRDVPWIAQEAFAFGCLYAASIGLGSALAKIVGGFLLTFIVLVIVLKFAFPSYRKWVSERLRIQVPNVVGNPKAE